MYDNILNWRVRVCGFRCGRRHRIRSWCWRACCVWMLRMQSSGVASRGSWSATAPAAHRSGNTTHRYNSPSLMSAAHQATRSNWTETNYTELNQPATDPRTPSDCEVPTIKNAPPSVIMQNYLVSRDTTQHIGWLYTEHHVAMQLNCDT